MLSDEPIFIRSKIKGKAIHSDSQQGRILDRESSKQYLTGGLSSEEKYQLEDRLLDHDFSYEAMEGLEAAHWQQCEKHLLQTEQRIIDEFSLQKPLINRTVLIALAGLFTSTMLAVWYFSSDPGTVDLSANETASAAGSVEKKIEQPDDQNSLEEVTIDTINTPQILNAPQVKNTPQVESTSQAENKSQVKPKANTPTPTVVSSNTNNKSTDKDVHIAVGRIIDIKGIAIVNAVVSSGNATDTTDNHGYFALEVPRGGARISVNHLTTVYSVDIDTNQNWEIILDVLKQEVYDYSPINTANRFK